MTVTARHYDDAVESTQPGSTPGTAATHAAQADGLLSDGGLAYLGEDDVDLSSDPFADDLADELAASAPRPAATRTTLALASAVLVVAGFIGGVLVQKNYGSTNNANNAAANALASFAAARGGFGNGGGNGGGNGFGNGGGTGGSTTTGTIKLVDGTTIYITTSDGSVVTVKTSGSTAVQATVPVTSLKAGATVTITGTTGSDGIITATRVTATK